MHGMQRVQSLPALGTPSVHSRVNPIDENLGSSVSRAGRTHHSGFRTGSVGGRENQVPRTGSHASAVSRMYFNDEKRMPTPSVGSTIQSRPVTSASLKDEVAQLVEAEMKKVVQPLQEQLKNEMAARERCEDLLKKIDHNTRHM